MQVGFDRPSPSRTANIPTLEAAEDLRDSVYARARRPCTCGSAQGPCSVPAHLAALDFSAATYQIKGHFDTALRHALMMVAMAPEKPDGYLRSAKVIVKSPPRPSVANLSTFDLARCFYKHGRANVSRFGDTNDPAMKVRAAHANCPDT